MAPPATVHLLCGSTGAGKTSYGRRLAGEIGGILFSIDEWMTALFWPDSPDPIDPVWAMERVARCKTLIWKTAVDLARAGTAPILEIGLTTAASRQEIAGWAAEAGLPVQLHFVDVPTEERWRRVDARNHDGGEGGQLSFAVTREMFDFVEGMWEPPGEAEMDALNGVRVC